jgi:hypothetical protein
MMSPSVIMPLTAFFFVDHHRARDVPLDEEVHHVGHHVVLPHDRHVSCHYFRSPDHAACLPVSN